MYKTVENLWISDRSSFFVLENARKSEKKNFSVIAMIFFLGGGEAKFLAENIFTTDRERFKSCSIFTLSSGLLHYFRHLRRGIKVEGNTDQYRTQDFEKGGPRTSENLRRTKTRMNIVSLKFSPIFCPKLGEDQKKKKRSSL